MLLLLCRCQLRHINHASINIATSILVGRRCHGIWKIRWNPTRYWRILQLMCCVLWRSGWMLKNRGHLRWINYWIIQWRRHRYHQWWKIVALWVNVIAIKAPVITRSCSLPTLIVPCSTCVATTNTLFYVAWWIQYEFVVVLYACYFVCLCPPKGKIQIFGAKTAVMFEFHYQE